MGAQIFLISSNSISPRLLFSKQHEHLSNGCLGDDLAMMLMSMFVLDVDVDIVVLYDVVDIAMMKK